LSAINSVVITERLLYGSALLLAAMLPFRLIEPVLVIAPVNLTNIQLLVIITALVWMVHLAALVLAGSLRPALARHRPVLPLVSAALIFLLAATLSTVLAPDHHANAASMVIRLVIAVYIMLLVIYVATTPRRIVGVLWVVIAGAGVSALLGLGEALNWPELNRALLMFKTAPSRVGGILRISGTFHYTTVASMFFEMALPPALVLAARAPNRIARVLALGVVVVCTAAVVLTLTRSGMGVLLVLGMLGIGLGVWRFRALLLPVVTMLATLLLVTGLLFLGEEAFRTRLTTEDDTNWYNAVYVAPETLTLEAGAVTTVAVDVENTGEVAWRNFGEHAYRLGYYWESVADDAPLDVPHIEIDLPRSVEIGERVQLEVEVQPRLAPGEYRIVWGMLQSNVLWFYHRNVPEARTLVEITPSTTTTETLARPQLMDTPPGGDIPTEGPVAVARLDLWRAAFAMWREYPLLGVGPDNYRLRYGPYLGYDVWYQSNHANNLYIELLATMGVFGLAAFLGFVSVVLVQSWRLLQRLQGQRQTSLLVLGLVGCLAASLLHGLFDHFLPWMSTLGLFWLVAGLIAALTVHTEPATS
jgi:hypothetical protein